MDDGKRGPDGKFESGHRYSLGKGRPATPADIKEARKANAADVERIINKYLHWSFKELSAFVKDENNTAQVLDCLIASIIARAIAHGDPVRLTFVLQMLGIKPVISTKESEGQNLHSQIVSVVNQIEGVKNGKEVSEEKSEDQT